MRHEKLKTLLADADARRKATDDPAEADYLEGYIRGLRRGYHGEVFGTPEEHNRWSNLVDRPDQKNQRRGQGYLDGIKAVQGGRKRPTASLTLPRKLLERMEQEKLPGESRSAQATRLIMEGLRLYKDRIGDIVTGEVYQVWKRETLVLDDDGNELILPKPEQIPSDHFRKGDTIRAVVIRVEMKNNTPNIILSRTSPVFLERLFELEVPEIFDGLITIRKIVRVPGERAKVAVESYDERIDPVGACVGMKGSRIHGIVRELRNENIDVINYTSNIQLFISRALNPAKISSIKLIESEKKAEIYLKPSEVSLAIGKGGLNIKLAGQLTGYDIEVYREPDNEDEEDVSLDEFADEIEGWIIDELKAIGCDTARSVLRLTVHDLVKRTDLEEETIKEVVSVLRSEFEKE